MMTIEVVYNDDQQTVYYETTLGINWRCIRGVSILLKTDISRVDNELSVFQFISFVLAI